MSNSRDESPQIRWKLAGGQSHTFDGNVPLGLSSNHCDSLGQRSNLICYSLADHNIHYSCNKRELKTILGENKFHIELLKCLSCQKYNFQVYTAFDIIIIIQSGWSITWRNDIKSLSQITPRVLDLGIRPIAHGKVIWKYYIIYIQEVGISSLNFIFSLKSSFVYAYKSLWKMRSKYQGE